MTLKHFVATFVDDIQFLGTKNTLATFQQKQGLSNKGLFTVEYPDEKLAVPERFRFVPFLVTYNHDDPEYPSRDWCTSCGICAKVCPPQCIWIVRGTDPNTGRPKPEPEQFYIDIDICMNCGYCAEYCPFDAIKMDHDYELASYDRTSNHIFDKPKLSKEIRYWETIAPTTAAEELVARKGYDHSDVQKARKKAGLELSRPGPVSDKLATAPVAEVAVAPAAEVQGQPSAAAPAAGAATTADGKVIVRRRGAGVAKNEGEGAAPAAPATPRAPRAAVPGAPAATPVVAAPPAKSESAPAGDATAAEPKSVPKRVVDPNSPPPVVRRRNNPPPKKE
ncbi:MAG: 4Fe-4S binding protein [Chloroflexota bacterium]